MIPPSKTFNEILRRAERSPEFHEQGAILDFTEGVVKAMKEQKLTNAKLAKRLKMPVRSVARVLQGKNAFTIKMMTTCAMAIGMTLKISLEETKQR